MGELVEIDVWAPSDEQGKGNMRYTVVIEKSARNSAAYVPDLPGCVATGATYPEVLREIREAMQFHIEGMREHGEQVPEPECSAVVVDLTAGSDTASADDDAMTVEDLIAVLREYPRDMRVVVNGYEDGFDDLSPAKIQVTTVALNVGTREYVGMHGDPSEAEPDTPIVEALVLQRTSC